MADAHVSDHWQRGSPYERYVGRWSRQVAPRFLAWLGLPPGLRWLDVGCGTGALSAAILEGCAPAAVSGVEPSEGFLAAAGESLAGRVALQRGSATALPLPDRSVDAVVSGLVLNFVDDQAAALSEMGRVTVAGGTVAAYVWDYAGRMQLMRHFWDAAVALDPNAAGLDEGVRFPLCRPAALEKLFLGAGLRGVAVAGIDIPTPFASFDDYWQPFLGGQGPAPAYAMSLTEAARARLCDRIREQLPVATDGSIALVARAWAVRGTVAPAS
ncbi:methyltransferase domain-containing protein [Ramlibacter sp. RBP-2]|uniref:Methyltransferase domain-containing protein n=1 Tax=Ramlibacter lithotrophicus TaxID=2606681 RepID=A0A7X6DJD4_9BURK|nr:methyltransferase domain-containing protein [Ramlibacter lithotrophicus]NKE68249.1 methyltransferase domain-containing protein [Ramlibacter lithotrophicus]